MNWTIWIFSEKFSKLMCQKLWFSLCEKMEWKVGQRPLFSRFWDEEAFIKIFRNSIFSSAKGTPSCAKIMFFLRRKQGLQSWNTCLRKSLHFLLHQIFQSWFLLRATNFSKYVIFNQTHCLHQGYANGTPGYLKKIRGKKSVKNKGMR